MARVQITLEDERENVTMRVEGATAAFPTSAQALGKRLVDVAELENRLRQMPRHCFQPSTDTLH